jgi:hypothetical protein
MLKLLVTEGVGLQIQVADDIFRSMGRIVLIALLLTYSFSVNANDGAFYAAGNHLIPIQETSITVKKEVLSMKKVDDKFIEVTVYYEFNNPDPEKTITVGFEAGRPLGDVDGTPRKGQHPYIYDFTVQMNGYFLKYDIAYVNDALYEEKGVVKTMKLDDALKSIDNENVVDFGYVYHFKARFKPGINIIKHTYAYKVSNSVEMIYDIQYVLTAAKRWGNKQIDDFTLMLDMGNFETFNLKKTFFLNVKDWTLLGVGKFSDTTYGLDGVLKEKVLRFHIRKGVAMFHQLNFRPSGEIELYSENMMSSPQDSTYLPFSLNGYDFGFDDSKDEFLRKVYRNLPFARRGYVFQSADLQAFFSKLDWYMPDPNYQPDVEMLDEREKKWISRWK